MELFETIKNRRSIRRYKTDPVSDEKINAILEAGRWAPSWANSQCWRFIVVRDADIKSKLADTAFGVADRPNRASEAFRQAPVVIVACAELGKSGYSASEPRKP